MPDETMTDETLPDDTMTATLTVDAPVDAVFAVLADPATHAAIDGTGWVRDPVDRAPLAEEGQVFRVHMFHTNHPDGDYLMANQVHVIDAPRAIGWRPGQEGERGLEFGGWTWRYDLTPAGSGTEVVLTYDWAQVPPAIREFISFPPFGQEHLTNSLQHLGELAGAPDA